MLTAERIRDEVARNSIEIKPFDPGQLGPCYYRYRLDDTYAEVRSEWSLGEPAGEIVYRQLPTDGAVLVPGKVYLFNTLELIGSSTYTMSLNGLLATGRLGLFVHISADLGHTGAAHKWTLELTAVQPVRVYPGMLIGQVAFFRPAGEILKYRGLYSTHSKPMPNLKPINGDSGA